MPLLELVIRDLELGIAYRPSDRASTPRSACGPLKWIDPLTPHRALTRVVCIDAGQQLTTATAGGGRHWLAMAVRQPTRRRGKLLHMPLQGTGLR